MTNMIKISLLRRDGGTQPRARMNPHLVAEYAREMRAGDGFPPVVVFFDGVHNWLADGYHCVAAAAQIALDEIECDVRDGTREDAQWYSFAANRTPGQRQTNADKRRAVIGALKHSAGTSDRVIAAHVGVDNKTVANWRAKLEAGEEIPHLPLRHASDGKVYNIAKWKLTTKPALHTGPEHRPSADAPSGTGASHESDAAADAVPTGASSADHDGIDKVVAPEHGAHGVSAGCAEPTAELSRVSPEPKEHVRVAPTAGQDRQQQEAKVQIAANEGGPATSDLEKDDARIDHAPSPGRGHGGGWGEWCCSTGLRLASEYSRLSGG